MYKYLILPKWYQYFLRSINSAAGNLSLSNEEKNDRRVDIKFSLSEPWHVKGDPVMYVLRGDKN